MGVDWLRLRVNRKESLRTRVRLPTPPPVKIGIEMARIKLVKDKMYLPYDTIIFSPAKKKVSFLYKGEEFGEIVFGSYYTGDNMAISDLNGKLEVTISQ